MKKKLLLSMILMISMLSVIAQNSSTGPLDVAKTQAGQQTSTPDVKPLPNPETDFIISVNEGFDNVSTLTANGWPMINKSNPIGGLSWFQPSGVFNAYDGAANAYIGVNYNSTFPVGTISNWLITPVCNVHNGDVLTFYTRTPAGSIWPDRLEVRLSINGNSSDVGGNEFSVGDFTNLLLSVNPLLAVHGYPEAWTQFTVTVSGLTEYESGRFAFRYFVTDGGTNGNNSNCIGIDRVQFVENEMVPVSNWAIAPGIGLILVFTIVRFRRLV